MLRTPTRMEDILTNMHTFIVAAGFRVLSLVRVAIGGLQGPCIQQYGIHDHLGHTDTPQCITNKFDAECMPRRSDAAVEEIDLVDVRRQSDTINMDEKQRSEGGFLRPAQVAEAAGERDVFGEGTNKQRIDQTEPSESGDLEPGKALCPGQWRALRDHEVTRLFDHALGGH
jgi:hypothetical protein